MLMLDCERTPLAAMAIAASISEVQPVETTVDTRVPNRQPPKRLSYDKAADANCLWDAIDVRGIALSCPHRAKRTKRLAQNGRELRRYKRRYKVERSISWLHNCHRLITRWKYHSELFEGVVHLGCLYTILEEC